MSERLQALFGRRLRQLRVERGLSQATLAERIDVTPEYVSRIERGRVGPSMEILSRLGRALGVDVRDLFDFDVHPARRDPTVARLEQVATAATGEDRQVILRIAEIIATSKRRRR